MRLPTLLVAVALLDELGSGIPFVGAPEIRASSVCPVPLGLGLVADRAGLTAALALLAIQPIGIALVAAADRRGVA